MPGSELLESVEQARAEAARIEMCIRDRANYSASKAGVIGLTKAVARELAGRGICCNAIAPGLIETDMTEALDKTALLSSIPLGRAGKPEDVAALTLFLAGPGGDYITGEVIRVDGGMAI